jgi:hypothetical protein
MREVHALSACVGASRDTRNISCVDVRACADGSKRFVARSREAIVALLIALDGIT